MNDFAFSVNNKLNSIKFFPEISVINMLFLTNNSRESELVISEKDIGLIHRILIFVVSLGKLWWGKQLYIYYLEGLRNY